MIALHCNLLLSLRALVRCSRGHAVWMYIKMLTQHAGDGDQHSELKQSYATMKMAQNGQQQK